MCYTLHCGQQRKRNTQHAMVRVYTSWSCLARNWRQRERWSVKKASSYIGYKSEYYGEDLRTVAVEVIHFGLPLRTSNADFQCGLPMRTSIADFHCGLPLRTPLRTSTSDFHFMLALPTSPSMLLLCPLNYELWATWSAPC